MTRASLPRLTVIGVTALAVLLPLGLIFYQSLLNAPFFAPNKSLGLGAFAFIFDDSDFWDSFRNSLVIAGPCSFLRWRRTSARAASLAAPRQGFGSDR